MENASCQVVSPGPIALNYRRKLSAEPLETRDLLAITVTTELDVVDAGDGLTSLREAIDTANAEPDPDDIVFDFGHDGPAVIRLEQGELEITAAVTITGDGPDLLTIDAGDGTDNIFGTGDGYRIFNVDDGTANLINVQISGVTLTGGDVDGYGGAISNREYLAIVRSAISDNSASSEFSGGGGIFNSGTVTVTGSVLLGNSASGKASDGGGIFNSGTATITQSTLAGSSAGRGGGISSSGTATISQSTLNGNSAELGGGVFNRGTATITQSTLAGNSATARGGGITSSSGMATVIGSIVAGNLAPQGAEIEVSGGSVSLNHYNLLGDSSKTTTQALSGVTPGATDITATSDGTHPTALTSMFETALADNGGPTRTLALLPGSPAIDAGDPAALAGTGGVPLYDQRGEPYTRVANGNGATRIDIGAYERHDLTVGILQVASPTATPVDAVTIQFSNTVHGFDLGDLVLSLNGDADNLLTSGQTLSTSDDQTFVLSGLAEVTTAAGYYTLQVIPESEIVDAAGGPLDSGDSINWAMGRSVLGLTVDTLVDEADGSIDDGDISIRDAIAAAAPGETIDFDAALDGGTILLSLGELVLTRAITVDATDLTSGLTIDAAGNDPTPGQDDGRGSRIFNIDDGDFVARIAVEINGLTLTGGDVAGTGGALFSRENLTLSSSTLSGNSAFRGGGIYSHYSGTATITGSMLSGNSASGVYSNGGGGAIFNSGTVTITGSTLSGNSTSGEFREGGGGGDGGGIFNSGTAAIISTTLSGNSASSEFSRGGGIFNSGTATINGSTLLGNAADSGGGVYIRTGTTTITGSTLSGNSAASDYVGGGGVRNHNSGDGDHHRQHVFGQFGVFRRRHL